MSKLGIGTGITPDDGNGDSLLEGAVKVNSNFDELYSYFGDGTDLTSGSWQKVSSGINTTLNVGIGTTNPRFALEVGAVGSSGTSLYVNGDVRVTGILTVGSSSISLDGSNNILKVGTGVTVYGNTGIASATSFYASNTIKVGSGVTIYGNTGIISATDFYASGLQVGVLTASTIIYEGSVLQSYWSETSAGIHTLSNVGIGTTNPTSALTVKGNTSIETLNVSGVSTFQDLVRFQGNAVFEDSDVLYFGNGNDLEIYHNQFGPLNVIKSNTDMLFGVTNEVTFAGATGLNTVAKFRPGYSNVELYYDGNKKFETLGAGVTVTGTTFTNQLNVSGVSTFVGNAYFDSIVLDNQSSSISGRSRVILRGGWGGDVDFYAGGTSYSDFTFTSLQSGLSRDVASITGYGVLNLPYIGGGLNIAGISTFVGIATAQSTLFANQLSISGVSTFIGSVRVGVDTLSGVILTSENGTQYRLIVDNAGALSTVAV